MSPSRVLWRVVSVVARVGSALAVGRARMSDCGIAALARRSLRRIVSRLAKVACGIRLRQSSRSSSGTRLCVSRIMKIGGGLSRCSAGQPARKYSSAPLSRVVNIGMSASWVLVRVATVGMSAGV